MSLHKVMIDEPELTEEELAEQKRQDKLWEDFKVSQNVGKGKSPKKAASSRANLKAYREEKKGPEPDSDEDEVDMEYTPEPEPEPVPEPEPEPKPRAKRAPAKRAPAKRAPAKRAPRPKKEPPPTPQDIARGIVQVLEEERLKKEADVAASRKPVPVPETKTAAKAPEPSRSRMKFN
jgi:hypothetical protein